MRRPFRFWMSGCAAVVMAGLVGGRTARSDDELLHRLASRYGKSETEQRIFERAGQKGYDVFARLDAPDAPTKAADTVFVFRAPSGGTPVLMASSDAEPSLPLSVRVRRGVDGGTEVVVSGADWELPAEVAHDLSTLRRLVVDALT